MPSICYEKELFATQGKQEVKIEFIFSDDVYEINRIKNPELFALETERDFGVLDFRSLFADKLTTLGPNTIGISDDRSDEQVKQIYDVITLFTSNLDMVLRNKDLIKLNYEKVAKVECLIHDIKYDSQLLFEDMKVLVSRLKNIETDSIFLQLANDFQALYLRKSVNRDKAQWAIVGFQLDLLVDYIFIDDKKILRFRDIEELISKLRFDHIQGPDRGILIREARVLLEENFNNLTGLSQDLFKKRMDRIIWELVIFVDFPLIQKVLIGIIE